LAHLSAFSPHHPRRRALGGSSPSTQRRLPALPGPGGGRFSVPPAAFSLLFVPPFCPLAESSAVPQLLAALLRLVSLPRVSVVRSPRFSSTGFMRPAARGVGGVIPTLPGAAGRIKSLALDIVAQVRHSPADHSCLSCSPASWLDCFAS